MLTDATEASRGGVYAITNIVWSIEGVCHR